MTTTNIGNQALSTELIRLMGKICAGCDLTFLDRHSALARYSLSTLRHAGSDPFIVFEGWAEKIAKEYQCQPHPLPRAWGRKATVKLLRPRSYSLKLLPIKHFLQVRAKLAYLGAYGKSYEKRLSMLENADLVLYNAAGEINLRSADVALRQLLELRVAQKLGSRVLVVNHSVEVQDPIFLSIVKGVYTKMDSVLVRDPFSKQALVEMGVPEEKINVIADMAFLATPADSTANRAIKHEAIEPGTVAIALNSHNAAKHYAEWGRIIRELQGRGKQVLFVSNALWEDRRIGEELRHRYGVQVMSQQYEYQEYMELLSRVELVISSRLHTCILAMLGDTPVVPVEPFLFKVRGIFQLIDYPVGVIDTSAPSWVADSIGWIDYLYENYDAVRKKMRQEVWRARKSIEEDTRRILLQVLKRSEERISVAGWEPRHEDI
jgi:polysaccharide pyruvyl transferase WcaK-like protein